MRLIQHLQHHILILSGLGSTRWHSHARPQFQGNNNADPYNRHIFLISPVLLIWQIDLPVVTSRANLEALWNELMDALPDGCKPTTRLLQSASDHTAAWLAFLVEEWQISETTVSELDFISNTIETKLYNEAFVDWSTALEAMSDEQRKWMLNLSDVLEGQDITSLFHYNMGLRPLLSSYLQPVQPGSSRLFLSSSAHRKIIQVGCCSEFPPSFRLPTMIDFAERHQFGWFFFSEIFRLFCLLLDLLGSLPCASQAW